jgi:HK97 family phage major capsid protein
MAVAGNKTAHQWCQDSLGIDVQNAMSGSSDSDGGFLIPVEYEANLIRLVNEYGVIRRSAEIVPMARDVKDTPRRTNGITGYWIGETGTPTETTPTLDMVKLVAKKLGALSYYSRDVDEDSAIAVGNLITQEMALAMAYNEDNAGFNGDGTSTYGGIVGVKNALAAGAKYTAIAGNIGFQKLDLEDFEGMIAKLPSYGFMNGGPSWYIHRSGWALSMLRLAAAAGGNTTREIAGGASQVQFLGYPVVFVEVMNNTTGDQASTDGLVYFGNLRQGVKFGDRRGVTVDLSREVKFLTQQIAILGTERFDIKVHETGTASVAGSIVMLSTPGS